MTFTIIFNTIIIVVLTRPKMRTATNTVLLGMAICDLMTISLPAPIYIFYYTLGYHIIPQWSRASCFLFEFALEIIPQLFHTTSNWLTLVLALQRYVFICKPTSALQYCTVSKARFSIILLMMMSSLHLSPRIFDREYFVENFGSASESECIVHFSPWLINFSISIYFKIFFWFRVIFIHFLPCTSLV